MAEEKLDEVQQPLPCKRKPSDVEPLDQSNPIQKVKLDSSSDSPIINNHNGASAAAADNLSPIHSHSASISAIDEEEDIEEEDYEDDEEEEDEDDEEEDEGEVDRKGKGIMTHDVKGKGKLIEESESDSSDDDEVGTDFDDDESDLDEDPLAEVDLDNILPSRTRQRGRAPHRSGISLSDNAPKDHDK